MGTVKTVDEAAACAALAPRFPGLPEGHQIKADRLPNTALWTVQVYDEEGRPYAGEAYLVGPDGRLWELSSNAAFHDPDLAIRLLDMAYASDFADRLDPRRFADRVGQLTEAREQAVSDFLHDLRSGALGDLPRHRLP